MKVSKARISYSRVEINSGSMLNFGRIIWGLLENPPWMSRSYISFPIELTMVIFQVVMSVFRFFFHPWSLRWILWHNTEFSRGLKPSFIIKQMQKVIIQQRSPDAVRLKTRRCPCGLKDQSYPSTCWAIADCYYWSGSCQLAVNLWDAVFPGDLVFEPELPMGVHSFFALKFGYMKNGFVSSSHVSIVVLTTEKTSRNFIKVPFF